MHKSFEDYTDKGECCCTPPFFIRADECIFWEGYQSFSPSISPSNAFPALLAAFSLFFLI